MTTERRRNLAHDLLESDAWKGLLDPELAQRIREAEATLLDPNVNLPDAELARQIRTAATRRQVLLELHRLPHLLAPPPSESVE